MAGTKKPRVCVARTAGTNCDRESAFAFESVGASARLVHINRFVSGAERLSEYDILVLPGGFTYGDDLGAGRLMANELRFKLADEVKQFIDAGKLIIGICNGFQILVKSGLLPGSSREQEASLIINDNGSFQDRWVSLAAVSQCRTACIWTAGLPDVIRLPIAHGEGKFVASARTRGRLAADGQVVLRYCGPEGQVEPAYNPNASQVNIAGICDSTGRILGMMPHPERYICRRQEPSWQADEEGHGLRIIRNGVEYAIRHLL